MVMVSGPGWKKDNIKPIELVNFHSMVLIATVDVSCTGWVDSRRNVKLTSKH